MKFHLVRPALVLASSLVLASCGGGGKETFPVKVTVFNVQYPGLVLTTNGQELAIPVPAKAGDNVVTSFPNGLDYGTYYNVVPKGGTAVEGGGSQPAHQNCFTAGYPNGNYPREYGTAGQTASIESARTPAIEVFYQCQVNQYALSGTVTGLNTDGATLTLINGSNSQIVVTRTGTATDALPFTLATVPYNTSFGVTVLTQPAGYTCTVANGVGVMDDALEKLGGNKTVAVTCVKNS
jgi:hypothetical protein